MKINIPCELNQKKMWLSKPSHIEGLLLSPSTLSICLRDCFRPPNPHPPPYNCPCPFLCSFLLLQTDRVLKKGFIGLDAPSDSGGRLPPWHAQVSSTRPSTGLPATCVQPSLGLNCGEEWKQSGGTEAPRKRKRKRKGNRGKETWRLRRSKKGGGGESGAWTTIELQRLALRNRLVHHLAGVSSRNRTPSWQTGSFLIVSSCLSLSLVI